MTGPSLQALSKRFGVTRLARLTGLDRCGVEVVGAVRPRGHVLQVSQGKGLTLEAAKWSALGEALELAAAEAPDPARLRFGPPPGDALWSTGDEAIAWVDGELLSTGEAVSVPAEAVYCPPAGVAWLGPSSGTWRSNGLGAHPTSPAKAIEHAVLEIAERDALARVLPDGWTPAVTARLVALPTALAGRFAERGFELFVFDLTPAGDVLPVAGALLFDAEEGPVPLTAGYACRRTLHAAAEAAVLEAAQSRLTEIHGAREDVSIGQREAGRALREVLQAAPTQRAPRRAFRGPLSRALRAPVAIVTLRASPWVVKAVSAELLVSELL
jgi:ribosomal protein S12 methylthiotransferase accessory factor